MVEILGNPLCYGCFIYDDNWVVLGSTIEQLLVIMEHAFFLAVRKLALFATGIERHGRAYSKALVKSELVCASINVFSTANKTQCSLPDRAEDMVPLNALGEGGFSVTNRKKCVVLRKGLADDGWTLELGVVRKTSLVDNVRGLRKCSVPRASVSEYKRYCRDDCLAHVRVEK